MLHLYARLALGLLALALAWLNTPLSLIAAGVAMAVAVLGACVVYVNGKPLSLHTTPER